VTGKIQTTGDVVAGAISLQNHVHTGVLPGGSVTGGPV
jgi:phage baseplate assembly protein gpV